MRYQVPQFVDIEDKIIGPLTLKQFLMYFSAVLLLIPVYLFSDLSLFLTLSLPVVAVAAAFAHFKPGGKSLFSFMGNAAGFFLSSRIWTWRRAANRKFLPVRGRDIEPDMGGGLAERAQQIETGGNISTEDVEDPLLPEEQTPSPPSP
ncbi:MAG: PrgI family protein [Patescibacteria group bacterium]